MLNHSGAYANFQTFQIKQIVLQFTNICDCKFLGYFKLLLVLGCCCRRVCGCHNNLVVFVDYSASGFVVVAIQFVTVAYAFAVVCIWIVSVASCFSLAVRVEELECCRIYRGGGWRRSSRGVVSLYGHF